MSMPRTSRPSCYIGEVDMEYLLTSSWYFPMTFVENGRKVLWHSSNVHSDTGDVLKV